MYGQKISLYWAFPIQHTFPLYIGKTWELQCHSAHLFKSTSYNDTLLDLNYNTSFQKFHLHSIVYIYISAIFNSALYIILLASTPHCFSVIHPFASMDNIKKWGWAIPPFTMITSKMGKGNTSRCFDMNQTFLSLLTWKSTNT